MELVKLKADREALIVCKVRVKKLENIIQSFIAVEEHTPECSFVNCHCYDRKKHEYGRLKYLASEVLKGN